MGAYILDLGEMGGHFLAAHYPKGTEEDFLVDRLSRD